MGIIKQMWLEELDARGILETEYDPDFLAPDEPLLRADQLRQHINTRTPMNLDEMEFRYERRGDMYMTKCWYNGTEKTERGSVYDMPGWLKSIVDVSRVGNHIKATQSPPPDEILWFRTDTKGNLTTFIDLEDPK